MSKTNVARFSIMIICLLIVVISIFSFRVVNRNVLDVFVVGVKIEKSVNWDDGALSKEQKTAIKTNPDNYIYLDYMLEVKNSSNIVRVTDLYIRPEFFGDIKSIVFWFDSTDEIGDNVRVQPNSTRKCWRRIIVKNNGLSDKELISMSKSVKFQLTYNTFKGNSILSFLSYSYDSKVFGYKEK